MVLAPPGEDHILSSTSVIQQADYQGHLTKFYGLNFENIDSNKVELYYNTFDSSGTERIKLTKKPSAVLLDYKPLAETKTGQGFEWQPLENGGLLVIRRLSGKRILLLR